MPNQTRLLVFEDEGQSHSAALELTKTSLKTTVAAPEEGSGVSLAATGQSIAFKEDAFDQLVLVGEGRWTPNFAVNHLHPGQTVIALSEIDQWQPQSDKKQHILFLNGVFAESHPAVAGRVMSAALQMQTTHGETGLRTLIFTHNLKVAGNGLEALYQECKRAGVQFVKFTKTRPEIEQDEKGPVSVHFIDEASGQNFYLKPDLTVVDESLAVPGFAAPLCDLFRLEKDAQGFYQADNVHRLPVGTNHRAIWVADAFRATLTPEEAAADLANAALAPLMAAAEPADSEQAAAINPNHCVRCLTCFRACPHGAVVMAPHPVINTAWCQSCGICVAECPKHAIQMIATDEISASIGISSLVEEAPSKRIVVFGCARSAVTSAELASLEGHPLKLEFKLVAVPCAGSLSSEHLLKALAQEVDGVLVLTCHADNCNAGSGNCLARDRVEALTPMLDQIGFDTQRLAIATLANNMGAGFAQTLNRFAGQLAELKAKKER